MAKITFRSPNYKSGKAITIKGFKLDTYKVYCNHCGVELSEKEICPSVITLISKKMEGTTEIEKRHYVTKYLCFDCIELLTGRRPDDERSR